MKYEKSIKVKKAEIERLQALLNKDEIDFELEGIETDATLLNRDLKFDNGFTASVKVCSGQTNCWSEAVLFNNLGFEISVTEPAFDILGEYNFSFKQDEYIIYVEMD